MARQLKSKRNDRQGVLILVVLSMLVLFTLVAVAFVINASQSRTAAKAASRRALGTGTGNPEQQLDDAVRQLIRGTKDPKSVLFDDNGTTVTTDDTDYSLLADMYGAGAKGTISAINTTIADGQFVDISVTNALPQTAAGSYDGCVLTFLDGPAKNVSTRIVIRAGATDTQQLRVVRPESDAMPEVGNEFLINGRPFNDTVAPLVNEDYDAADRNNWHLAAIIPNGSNPAQIIPSFDRSQTPATAPTVNTLRVFGEVAGAPTAANAYPWDVDNDGDGKTDSVWIDLGYAAQSDAQGRRYKPLFAILCTDLDGRVNVNAHGLAAHTTTPSAAIGQGYGPPEINLRSIGLSAGNVSSLLTSRYITANQPGAAGFDDLARIRFSRFPVILDVPATDPTWGDPDFYDNRLSAYGTPPDLLGSASLALDAYGVPNYQNTTTIQHSDSPYELQLSQKGSTSDAPFSAGELEALLRYYDIDAAVLPERLKNLFDSFSATTVAEARNLVTNASFDLPVPGGVRPGVALDDLSRDLRMGVRMNLNRPFGDGQDDDGNGVVDDDAEVADERFWRDVQGGGFTTAGIRVDLDINETIDSAEAAAGPREQAKTTLFAKQIFEILKALDPTPAREQEYAQFAINVVDFRDADSIMSRFQYGPAATDVVWGCERPELLITETLAWHDRRTEDLEDPATAAPGNEGTSNHPTNPGTDPHFDQEELPRSGFFVELYNPWREESKKSGELYTDHATIGLGVELQKTTPGGNPVWRLAIDTTTDPTDDLDARAATYAYERSVYFVNPGGATPFHGGMAYYPSAALTTVLPTGHYAVVGSAAPEVGSSMDLVNSPLREIVLSHNTLSDDAIQVLNNEVANSRDPYPDPNPAVEDNPALAIEIDANASTGLTQSGMSVSEPVNGYPNAGWDGSKFVPPLDVPLDTANELQQDGTTEAYRMVHLQRLANPLKDWNATTNPYRTVDSMQVDLTAFNGVSNAPDPSSPPSVTTRFTSLQRGDTNPAAPGNNALWPYEVNTPAAATTGRDTNHYFDEVLVHSLGFMSDGYQAVPATPNNANQPSTPFPWLTWINRPYVSQAELLLVPKASSSRLLHDFSIGPTGSPIFGYLVNFYESPANDAYRKLLEYVHAPSRFVDSRTIFNPTEFETAPRFFRPPMNFVSNYRDPGRININTIYSEKVWDAVMHNGITSFPAHPGPSWNDLVRSRRGYGTTSNILETGGTSSFIEKPFRSYATTNRDDTLMRDGATTGTPLFTYSSNNAADNTDRNPYFRYQAQQRIANLVTTRSNVYAIWVTVGYFEVDADGDPVNRELGSDTGNIQRHRGFYLVDRSIPVAFEPGENHNVDKAIVLRRLIE